MVAVVVVVAVMVMVMVAAWVVVLMESEEDEDDVATRMMTMMTAMTMTMTMRVRMTMRTRMMVVVVVVVWWLVGGLLNKGHKCRTICEQTSRAAAHKPLRCNMQRNAKRHKAHGSKQAFFCLFGKMGSETAEACKHEEAQGSAAISNVACKALMAGKVSWSADKALAKEVRASSRWANSESPLHQFGNEDWLKWR